MEVADGWVAGHQRADRGRAVEALKGTVHKDRWLPGILAGETVAALAVDEGPKHRPDAIEMKAVQSGNGFSLSGSKQFVVQGASADFFSAPDCSEPPLCPLCRTL